MRWLGLRLSFRYYWPIRHLHGADDRTDASDRNRHGNLRRRHDQVGGATITITAPPAPITVSIAPRAPSVQVGGTQVLTATVTNDLQNKGVTWKLSGSGCTGSACGTLPATTGATITYTAPASVPAPPTVAVTATSVADNTKSASATVTITAVPAAIVVRVSPATANVPVGTTQMFTATVANDAQNKGVTWLLLGSTRQDTFCGSLSTTSSASGVAITYTAPPNVPMLATITLRAFSASDNTKSDFATITITSPTPSGITVSVTPKLGGLTVNQALTFKATISNDPKNAGVSWSSTGGGSFAGVSSTEVKYFAPSTPGTCHGHRCEQRRPDQDRLGHRWRH